VVEIATGKSTPLALPEKTVPRWLAGDVVVWLQEQGGGKWTLVRQRPGRDPEIWTSGETRNAQLWVSPGGERVIVLTLENGFHHAAVLDTRGAVLPPLPFQPLGRVAWAGPRTLAVTSARGRLRLYDVITGKTTVVFGGG
jgi:hypothetical protein